MICCNPLNFLRSYTTILKNTFYLSLMEIVHLILPFIALPYIIKIVGTGNYGKIVFAQVIVGYFMLFVNFGSDILAVKFVSRHRNHKKRLNLITGAILVLKGITFGISLTVFTLLVLLWQRARIDWLLFYSAFLICLTEIFFTPWFFQGIEKMFVITIVRCSSMLIYIASLFLFLHHTDQYWLVPLLQSAALLITSTYGFYYMCNKEKIFPMLPSEHFVKKIFRESLSFFLSRGSVVLNNSLATLIIGLTMSTYNVAVYDLARKITNASLIPVSMLIQAIYPHNALKRDLKFAMNAFAGIAICGITGCVILYFIAPYLVAFLGNQQLAEATPMVRFLLLHVLICIFTYYLGSPLLVAWGYSKAFNNSVLVSSIAILLIYLILYFYSINSIYWFASAVIIAELVIFLYRSISCIKYGIIKFS